VSTLSDCLRPGSMVVVVVVVVAVAGAEAEAEAEATRLAKVRALRLPGPEPYWQRC